MVQTLALSPSPICFQHAAGFFQECRILRWWLLLISWCSSLFSNHATLQLGCSLIRTTCFPDFCMAQICQRQNMQKPTNCTSRSLADWTLLGQETLEVPWGSLKSLFSSLWNLQQDVGDLVTDYWDSMPNIQKRIILGLFQLGVPCHEEKKSAAFSARKLRKERKELCAVAAPISTTDKTNTWQREQEPRWQFERHRERERTQTCCKHSGQEVASSNPETLLP